MRRFQFYKIERGNDLGNPETWNVRFEDIDIRFAVLERGITRLDDVAGSLVERGLQHVNDQVQEAVSALHLSVQNAEGQFDGQILEVTNQLAAAQQALNEAAESVQELENLIQSIVSSGSLPANGISLSPVDGLLAANVQDAVEQLLEAISSVNNDLSEQLGGKAPTNHEHAISHIVGLATALSEKASDSEFQLAVSAIGGKASSGVTIGVSGLATGGGDLSANRTITVPKAVAADFRGKSNDDNALTPKAVFDAAAPVSFAYAATINLNLNDGFNRFGTLTGAATFASPTGVVPGMSGTIRIQQDATGNRTGAFGSAWKFPGGTAPTLSTAANAVDALHYYAHAEDYIEAVLAKDVK